MQKASYDNGTPGIGTHAEARTLFDSRPLIKGTDERNPGKPAAKNRRMTRYPDGSIGFAYYDTEIVVYHPDGTLTLTALPEQRMNNFAQAVLPFGIHQDVGTRTGPVLYLARRVSTHASVWAWSLWSARHNEPEAIRVVRGHKPVHVKLANNHWRPADEAAIEPFEWAALDDAKARVAAKEVGIADFVVASKMVNALDALPPYKGTHTRSGTAQAPEIYERVLDALEARDYQTAMSLLKRTSTHLGYINGAHQYGPESISNTEMTRVRTALYKRVGALTEQSQRVMTYAEYVSLEGALKRFS